MSEDNKLVIKSELNYPNISAEEQKRRFEAFTAEMQALGSSEEEDEEDLVELLKKKEIWGKWAFMIQLLSKQALEKYGTVDITNEQMAGLFLEGLKEYRSTVNVDYLTK